MKHLRLTKTGDVRSCAGVVTVAEVERLSYRLSIGTDAAADLQQEAYLRLLASQPSRTLTRAEIFTRTRWHMLNAGEKRRCWERWNNELTDEVEDCFPDQSEDPETTYIQREEMETRIERLYAQVGHIDHNILYLLKRGYRKREIARKMGMSLRTVNRHLFHLAQLALNLETA